MKAMVLTAPDTPFQYMDVPDPVAGPGEAVAKVITCGSGLTIQHIRAGRSKVDYPRIIGHEITAEIVEVGDGVKDLKVGDPVTAYYYLTCGKCKWCRAGRETLCTDIPGTVGRACDGGYAEYIKLPENSFIKLPEGLDYKNHPAEVGVITDAIATPVKLIKKARIVPDEWVAVIGGGGGLGLQMIQVAKWAKVIAVDTKPEKFDACRDAGADAVINPAAEDLAEALLATTGGIGADAVIDFVGARSALEGSFAGLNRGGRLVLLSGAPQPFMLDTDQLKMEREVMGSKYATRAEVRESLELAARGEIWPIVSEVVPLKEAEALHARLEKGLITGRAAVRVAP
jgi:propanol-preferring alcohol dehydrogenase